MLHKKSQKFWQVKGKAVLNELECTWIAFGSGVHRSIVQRLGKFNYYVQNMLQGSIKLALCKHYDQDIMSILIFLQFTDCINWKWVYSLFQKKVHNPGSTFLAAGTIEQNATLAKWKRYQYGMCAGARKEKKISRVQLLSTTRMLRQLADWVVSFLVK